MNSQQIDYIKNDCKEALDAHITKFEKLRNQCVFISGASGFVGKWVIESINYLNENFHLNIRVYAYATMMNEVAKKYPSIFAKEMITLIDGDIKNLTEIDANVAYVLHLAATPDNRVYSSNPIMAMEDIMYGTSRILSASTRLENLLNFTMLSSGAVNGPIPFNDELIKENTFYGFDSSSLFSFYAEAKRASESILQAYRTQFKIPVTIFRPFSFIGPYQSIDRPWAINNFIRDGLRGEPIRIIGDEETVRSYMYPSEMAKWILLGMANPSRENIFNLGSDEGKSIRIIAETVEQSFAAKVGLSVNISPNNLIKSKFVPAIEKFEQAFDLKLNIGTVKAIQKTVAWHRLGS